MPEPVHELLHSDTPAPARHRHEFHMWPMRFGPYGDQSVHYHICTAHYGENGEPDREPCNVILVQDGHDCHGGKAAHRRWRYSEEHGWRPTR